MENIVNIRAEGRFLLILRVSFLCDIVTQIYVKKEYIPENNYCLEKDDALFIVCFVVCTSIIRIIAF